MRLFFAVELPSDVQSVLGRLGPKDESRDYRWTDPSLLHVTLAFLGEQPTEKLDVLQQVGGAAASASQTGTLRLGNAGAREQSGAVRKAELRSDSEFHASHAGCRNSNRARRASQHADEKRA